MSNFVFKTSTGLILGILLWAILLFAAANTTKGGTIDACEIACGPVFTQCLIDNGTSVETPDPRIERECRRFTEATCIRPCRKASR